MHQLTAYYLFTISLSRTDDTDEEVVEKEYDTTLVAENKKKREAGGKQKRQSKKKISADMGNRSELEPLLQNDDQEEDKAITGSKASWELLSVALTPLERMEYTATCLRKNLGRLSR